MRALSDVLLLLHPTPYFIGTLFPMYESIKPLFSGCHIPNERQLSLQEVVQPDQLSAINLVPRAKMVFSQWRKHRGEALCLRTSIQCSNRTESLTKGER